MTGEAWPSVNRRTVSPLPGFGSTSSFNGRFSPGVGTDEVAQGVGSQSVPLPWYVPPRVVHSVELWIWQAR